MAKHTPTPWEVVEGSGRQPYHIRGGDWTVARVEWREWDDDPNESTEANAAFIVQAVNAHDALVAACKQLLAVVDRLPNGHSAERVLSAQAGRAALKLAGE